MRREEIRSRRDVVRTQLIELKRIRDRLRKMLFDIQAICPHMYVQDADYRSDRVKKLMICVDCDERFYHHWDKTVLSGLPSYAD